MAAKQQTAQELFQKGLTQAKAGHKAEARKYFRQVLKLAPNNHITWLYLAGASNDPADALNAIQQAEALNPNAPGLAKAKAWFKETWPDYESLAPSPTSRFQSSLEAAAFILQKLAFGALVLLAITYLSYLGLDMARGVPFGEALGQAMAKSIAYLGKLFQGDLGLSAAGTIAGLPTPLSEFLPDLLAKSLGLLGFSLLIASLAGLTLGLLAAIQH